MVEIGKGMQRPGSVAIALSKYGFGLVIIAWLLADLVPRFFQGESLSYLTTGERWIPPDRSWAYGYMANFMLRHTHGCTALILVQTGALAWLIAASRVFFTGISPRIYGVTAILLALDPLLEIYTRFVMSDLLAAAAFFATLLALFALLREEGAARKVWFFVSLFIVSTVAAVFIRVAYALVIELVVLLSGFLMSRRLVRRQWLALAGAAAGPVIAVALLSAANSVVFGDRFQHEPFINKLSGVFLASIFAPALQMSDFEAAGIPLTATEFQRLDVTNYDRRLGHAWAQSPDYLHQLIKDRLGVTEDYTTEVDSKAARLVWSAFKRNPIAVARVYAWGAWQYASPSGWRAGVDVDLGLSRALPASFVDFSNRYSIWKIGSETTKIRSPLVRFYDATSYFYPLLLLTGLAAAGYLMIVQVMRPAIAVLAAGLIADVATAPLYSAYAIGRYVVAAVIISYLLIGLAIHAATARRGSYRAMAERSRNAPVDQAPSRARLLPR